MFVYLVLDDYCGDRVVSAHSTIEAAFKWIDDKSNEPLRYWIQSIEVDAKNV